VPAPPGDAVQRPGTGAASGPASDPSGDTASDAGIGWPL